MNKQIDLDVINLKAQQWLGDFMETFEAQWYSGLEPIQPQQPQEMQQNLTGGAAEMQNPLQPGGEEIPADPINPMSPMEGNDATT